MNIVHPPRPPWRHVDKSRGTTAVIMSTWTADGKRYATTPPPLLQIGPKHPLTKRKKKEKEEEQTAYQAPITKVGLCEVEKFLALPARHMRAGWIRFCVCIVSSDGAFLLLLVAQALVGRIVTVQRGRL